MDMEEKGWERLELDDEFQICYCASDDDEVRCYIIKVPDPEACPPTSYFSCPLLNLKDKKKEFSFTPKKLSPISQSKDPYHSRYFTLLGNLLYSVGGLTKDTDTDPDSVTYFWSREVWTLDLTCPEEGWKAAPSLKYGRQTPQTIVVDGKLYVFGGFGWDFEPEGSVEWMEVFDPSLGRWESLPNPPFFCADHLILYAHLEANDEIMVIKPLTKDGYEWNSAEFFSYNVRSRSWNELFQPSEERILINTPIQCGRALAIGNTLYWARDSVREDELNIYAFDLDKKLWASEYLNTRKIFGEREHLYSASSGFVHLSGLKFCLMSQSMDVDKFYRYLYCFVLDLSALFHGVLNKDSNEGEDDLHKEDDDGSVKSHLSILSIQKYLLDTGVLFLDCMIMEVWTLDLTCPEEGWKAAPSLKYGRQSPQTIVVDGKLYVFGGFGWDFEPEGSVEWMEVFDPSLGRWESLPNPPFFCADHLILYAHLEANDEIMVTKPLVKDGYEWNSAEFFSYNVRSRSWNELFQPSEERILINTYIRCGRALAIGNTLYWARDSVREDELNIYAFDLDKKLWASEYLNTRKIFGEREHLYSASSGFVHLSGLKFCLMSQSMDVDKFYRYLYCFVLDLSALFHGVLNKDSNEGEDDLHKEDDDGSVKSHLSILSIQKYLLDTGVLFLDCMIM
nr:putative f-box/kelch-repeat protein [Quercus suber]